MSLSESALRDQEGLGPISFSRSIKFGGDLEANPECLAATFTALV